MVNVTYTIGDPTLLLVLALIFGFIGFKRGWPKELLVTGFLLLGLILVGFEFDFLANIVNRAWVFFLFALTGGLGSDNPSQVLQQVRGTPLVTADNAPTFTFLVLVLCAIIGYILGERRYKALKGSYNHIVGFFAGLLNGFLIGYITLSRLYLPRPNEVTQVILPTGSLVAILKDYWIYAIVGAVIVLIVANLVRAQGR
ncbi:MAG: hypothetical protein EXR62_08355 [Chloroflexi bacterium]|nr:hypothetical protein [Chloroflexota bacterium]